MSAVAVAPQYLFDDPHRSQLRMRVVTWLVIAALHLGAIVWLYIRPHSAEPAAPEHTLMVSFVTPQPVSAEPVPVPPRPVTPAPITPAPKMIATPNPASASAITAPPDPPREETPPAPTAPPTPPVASAPVANSAEEVVTPPNFTAAYLNNPGARYPTASRRRREQGTVLLKVLVSSSGAPEQVQIARSSGFPELDQAALSVLRQSWKFVPASRGGSPVPAWVEVPMSFTLRDR